ncbi:MAG: hypothetical protein QNJ46_31635 [Leptolyngbyaceae cyanobacterium MO_188.B28]|nr:hypothetical protein [Leptolyngbyaceae cyanobacterium MO_188.B28]
MKTYWFTIACNPEFELLSQDLQLTAQQHGIEIHVVSDIPKEQSATFKRENILRLKLESILNAPSGYDRIAYIDADTLLVDPKGFETLQGSLKEPWRTKRSLVPGRLDWRQRQRWRQRLWTLLKQERLEEFCPGGKDFKQEWNTGVITGDRIFMEALAQEWRRWWDLILDVCDGYFERDQLSYKFAYTLVARRCYGVETIPQRYNCIVKRMGFQPDACILHRAGLPKGLKGYRYRQKRHHWATAKQMIVNNCYQSWSQSLVEV